MKIEEITTEQYIDAFRNITIKELEKKLIISNYDFPEHTITSRQMAQYMGFAGMAAANGNYGKFAKKFCKYFDVNIRVKVGIFVSFKKIENGWRWILRDNVARALEELGWVNLQIVVSNPFQELESFKKTKEYKTIEETTRDSVIKSRLGQGEYRRNLIEVWGGCSVTGCKTIEILRASHIKPWRFSSNSERLDPYNGLLLLPNLDILFDVGLISFDDIGQILISSLLSKDTLNILGVYKKMMLRVVKQEHKPYLEYHRGYLFRK